MVGDVVEGVLVRGEVVVMIGVEEVDDDRLKNEVIVYTERNSMRRTIKFSQTRLPQPQPLLLLPFLPLVFPLLLLLLL